MVPVVEEADDSLISDLCRKVQNDPWLLDTIRNHWAIENNLHWVLDVTFNQDRMHCRNADYLARRTALPKLAYKIISKAQANEEMETGKKSATKPQWLVRFNNVDFAVKCLSKITGKIIHGLARASALGPKLKPRYNNGFSTTTVNVHTQN